MPAVGDNVCQTCGTIIHSLQPKCHKCGRRQYEDPPPAGGQEEK